MKKRNCILQPLVTALYDGIKKRFGPLDATAAVSHPTFKNAWIKNKVRNNFAISLIKEAMCEINSDTVDNQVDGEFNDEKSSTCDSDQDDNNDSFFSWVSEKKIKM